MDYEVTAVAKRTDEMPGDAHWSSTVAAALRDFRPIIDVCGDRVEAHLIVDAGDIAGAAETATAALVRAAEQCGLPEKEWSVVGVTDETFDALGQFVDLAGISEVLGVTPQRASQLSRT